MSRDDHETGQTLYSPFVELERVAKDKSNGLVRSINASTFEPCLAGLIPTRTQRGPKLIEEPHCLVYAVVGFTVNSGFGLHHYLNIAEPPISRTLMGYITDATLKRNLPQIYDELYIEPTKQGPS